MNVSKKLQYENNLKVKPLIIAFKEEFLLSPYNKLWAEQRREEFLENEIEKMSKKSKILLIAFKKFKLMKPPEWLFNVAFELSEVTELLRKIKRHRNQLLMKHNKISPELIEQCREYPIVNLVKVIRFGSPQFGICPFHPDSDPSFAMYDDNSWFCFGCKVHGNNAIDFVMQRYKIQFMEAIVKLKNMEV